MPAGRRESYVGLGSKRQNGAVAQRQPPDVELYRGMKAAGDGMPSAGASAREIGARPGDDIPVDERGFVHPGTGGVSVAPESPSRLPEHRRPPTLGGNGKDPVWRLNSRMLPDALRYRADTDTHGTIEPASTMTLTAYQDALRETRSRWTQVETP